MATKPKAKKAARAPWMGSPEERGETKRESPAAERKEPAHKPRKPRKRG